MLKSRRIDLFFGGGGGGVLSFEWGKSLGFNQSLISSPLGKRLHTVHRTLALLDFLYTLPPPAHLLIIIYLLHILIIVMLTYFIVHRLRRKVGELLLPTSKCHATSIRLRIQNHFQAVPQSPGASSLTPRCTNLSIQSSSISTQPSHVLSVTSGFMIPTRKTGHQCCTTGTGKEL